MTLPSTKTPAAWRWSPPCAVPQDTTSWRRPSPPCVTSNTEGLLVLTLARAMVLASSPRFRTVFSVTSSILSYPLRAPTRWVLRSWPVMPGSAPKKRLKLRQSRPARRFMFSAGGTFPTGQRSSVRPLVKRCLLSNSSSFDPLRLLRRGNTSPASTSTG